MRVQRKVGTNSNNRWWFLVFLLVVLCVVYMYTLVLSGNKDEWQQIVVVNIGNKSKALEESQQVLKAPSDVEDRKIADQRRDESLDQDQPKNDEAQNKVGDEKIDDRRNGSEDEKNDKPKLEKFEIRFKNKQLKCNFVNSKPCPSETKILLMSLTRRDGFERRKGIRDTWMQDARSNDTIRFLMAEPMKDEEPNVRRKLDEEQAAHGDLVFIQGFNDTYKQIHLKWYAGMQWQQTHCNGTEWVLKVDDDSAVDLVRMNYWIDHTFRPFLLNHTLAYFGFIHFNDPVIRDKKYKWYVTENEYPVHNPDRYPDFTVGSMYLTTPATIQAILSKASLANELYLEDVFYTGILAELANVTRSHHPDHFAKYGIDEKDPKCENGVPRAFALWGFGQEDYAFHYKRIKSLECPMAAKSEKIGN